MKRLLPLVAMGALALGTSCTTTYDSYGRPVQSVTPEGAALAAVAAGVVGYAIADGRDNRHHRSRGHSYGHRSHGYGHSYGGYGGYCR